MRLIEHCENAGYISYSPALGSFAGKAFERAPDGSWLPTERVEGYSPHTTIATAAAKLEDELRLISAWRWFSPR